MYENIYGIPTAAYVQQAHQEAAAFQSVAVRISAAVHPPPAANFRKWMQGELGADTLLREAQITRFEHSIEGVRQELRTNEERKDFADVVKRALDNLENRIREAASNDEETGEILERVARIYIGQNDFREAYARYQEAFAFYKRAGDEASRARVLVEMAELDLSQMRSDSARERYLQAAQLFERMGDDRNLARTYGSLAQIYLSRQNWKQARATGQSALELLGSEPDLTADLLAVEARVHAAVGLSCFAHEDWGEAERSFRDALSRVNKLEDQLAEAQILTNLGAVSAREGHLSKAIDWYSRAFKTFQILGDNDKAEDVRTRIVELETRGRKSTY